MSASSNEIITVTSCPRVVACSDSQVETANLTQSDFEVRMLDGRPFASPVLANKREFAKNGVISDEHQYVVFDPQPFSCEEYASKVGGDEAGVEQSANSYRQIQHPISSSPFLLKMASQRATLHFNPRETVIGIVTCGGLCPGLNDVIRSLTLSAHGSYHVKKVLGFRYGYWGLSAAGRHTAVELTPENVGLIHRQGGTMLGSSRGGQNVTEMVDTLQHFGVNILFTAGGDGTQKGSLAIEEECRRRGLDIAIVGIPKTIDSDISISHRTFGYETAVEEAVRAIKAAHAEASSHEYGIGVVTLMGRHSGFIAAQATIASAQANICLIPEVKVSKETLIRLLETRFKSRKYCVVVVAEGFGQDWEECKGDHGIDASGNKKNANIGEIVKGTCDKFLKSNPRYKLSTVKYIDPSYMIRACPANPSDGAFCTRLSSLAVHEAMAGNTGCVISYWFGNFVLVPTKVCVSTTRKVNPQGHLWRQVRDLTVDGESNFTYDMELHTAASPTSAAAIAASSMVPIALQKGSASASSVVTESPNTAQITSLTQNAVDLLTAASPVAKDLELPACGSVPRQRVIVIRDQSICNGEMGARSFIGNPNGNASSPIQPVPGGFSASHSPATTKAVSRSSNSNAIACHAIRALSTGVVTAALIVGAMRLGFHKQ